MGSRVSSTLANPHHLTSNFHLSSMFEWSTFRLMTYSWCAVVFLSFAVTTTRVGSYLPHSKASPSSSTPWPLMPPILCTLRLFLASRLHLKRLSYPFLTLSGRIFDSWGLRSLLATGFLTIFQHEYETSRLNGLLRRPGPLIRISFTFYFHLRHLFAGFLHQLLLPLLPSAKVLSDSDRP